MPKSKKKFVRRTSKRSAPSPRTERTALSYVRPIATRAPTITSVGPNKVRVHGTELVGDVLPSSGFGLWLNEIDVNPTQHGPLLTAMAHLYNKFRAEKIIIHYVPTVAATEPGHLIAAYNQDITDDFPTGEALAIRQRVSAYAGSQAFPVSRPFSWSVPLDPTRSYSYISFNRAQGRDDWRFSFQGWMMLVAGSALTETTTYGSLYVEYTYVLEGQQIEESSVVAQSLPLGVYGAFTQAQTAALLRNLAALIHAGAPDQSSSLKIEEVPATAQTALDALIGVAGNSTHAFRVDGDLMRMLGTLLTKASPSVRATATDVANTLSISAYIFRPHGSTVLIGRPLYQTILGTRANPNFAGQWGADTRYVGTIGSTADQNPQASFGMGFYTRACASMDGVIRYVIDWRTQDWYIMPIIGVESSSALSQTHELSSLFFETIDDYTTGGAYFHTDTFLPGGDGVTAPAAAPAFKMPVLPAPR